MTKTEIVEALLNDDEILHAAYPDTACLIKSPLGSCDYTFVCTRQAGHAEPHCGIAYSLGHIMWAFDGTVLRDTRR